MRPEDVPFAKKALELNFIQQEQLNRCVQVQQAWQQQGSFFPIDQVMFHLKYLTQNHINIIYNQLNGGLPPQSDLQTPTDSDDKEDITVSFFLDDLPNSASQKLTQASEPQITQPQEPSIEASVEETLSLGSFPKERYEIVEEIENKGTEIVYRAYNPNANHNVALKVMFGNSKLPNVVEVYEIQ